MTAADNVRYQLLGEGGRLSVILRIFFVVTLKLSKTSFFDVLCNFGTLKIQGPWANVYLARGLRIANLTEQS
jgi:hypothetical protein